VICLLTCACAGKADVQRPSASGGLDDQGGVSGTSSGITAGQGGAQSVGGGDAGYEGTFTCPEYSENVGFKQNRELSGACSTEEQTCEFSGPAICPPGSTHIPDVRYVCQCRNGMWSCVSNGSSHSTCG